MVNWTEEKGEEDTIARWRNLTVGDIHRRKEEARDKIREAMQDLYSATGIAFEVEVDIIVHGETACIFGVLLNGYI